MGAGRHGEGRRAGGGAGASGRVATGGAAAGAGGCWSRALGRGAVASKARTPGAWARRRGRGAGSARLAGVRVSRAPRHPTHPLSNQHPPVSDYYPEGPTLYVVPGAWCDASGALANGSTPGLKPRASRRRAASRLLRADGGGWQPPSVTVNGGMTCSLLGEDAVSYRVGGGAAQPARRVNNGGYRIALPNNLADVSGGMRARVFCPTVSHPNTHTHTHARTHAHMHAYTHTHQDKDAPKPAGHEGTRQAGAAIGRPRGGRGPRRGTCRT